MIRAFLATKPGQALIRKGVELGGRDRRALRHYLRDHPVAGLQIGAGGHLLDGWLNTNFYPIPVRNPGTLFLDATKRFPIADGVFDYVFSEHMIEHVSHAGGQNMLRECFRVLKPGGRIRLSTPDMAFLTGLLAEEPSPLQAAYLAWASAEFLHDGRPHTALSVVDHFLRGFGHVFIYDRATLERSLAAAGFAEITAWRVNESGDPMLRSLEHADRFPEGFLQLETMTCEAVKPRRSASAHHQA